MSEPPSFYNSAATFEKYLGRTSYYRGLQDAVLTLATAAEPDRIAELGTGTGETAIRLADELPEAAVTAIDYREEALAEARENDPGLSNLSFRLADQTEYVAETDDLPEFVVLLYSFRYIPDPLREKLDFLEASYRALPEGGYLCLAERFLAQMQRNDAAETQLRDRWSRRGTEAYASTFWNSLAGLDEQAIERAQTVGEFSKQHEAELGEATLAREGQYPVSRDWLTYQARDAAGFEVVLSEPVNALGDGVVLLRK